MVIEKSKQWFLPGNVGKADTDQKEQGFPGGPVTGGLPSKARGCGLDPWSGKVPHDMQQLGPCATTTELALQSPGAAITEARKPQRPRSATGESPHAPN